MGVKSPLTSQGFNASLRGLRRRRLYRVAAAYVVVAWLAVQVADVLIPVFRLPEWGVRLVLSLALLGLPMALAIAWTLHGPQASAVAMSGPAPAASGRPSPTLACIVLLAVVAAALWAGAMLRTPVPVRSFSSIAVLPFADLSTDSDHQYLVDGIAEELLTRLSRLDGLRVAARSSSYALRGKGGDVRDIGERLNVDAVVEGSLRRNGDVLRINVQVIDARDGFNLWSRSYTRTLGDVLGLQAEVAEAIAAAVHVAGRAGRRDPTSGAGSGSGRAEVDVAAVRSEQP